MQLMCRDRWFRSCNATAVVACPKNRQESRCRAAPRMRSLSNSRLTRKDSRMELAQMVCAFFGWGHRNNLGSPRLASCWQGTISFLTYVLRTLMQVKCGRLYPFLDQSWQAYAVRSPCQDPAILMSLGWPSQSMEIVVRTSVLQVRGGLWSDCPHVCSISPTVVRAN